MSTYVIGDVQGCFDVLERLLDKIHFDSSKDTLWFTGDLINRGPKSMETLDFVMSLGSKAITVLGNHDLTLLAVSTGAIEPRPKDSFCEILASGHAKKWVDWLRNQPLIHHDPKQNIVMTHAGLFPLWSVEKALALGEEIHQTLKGEAFEPFMQNMFGNQPNIWDEGLTGWDRLRFITNAFTRMRYCTKNGNLDFESKGAPKNHQGSGIPWFEYPNPSWKGTKIIFGHWASLKGKCGVEDIFALDTGCVWGGCLTALCIETEECFHIDCSKQVSYIDNKNINK